MSWRTCGSPPREWPFNTAALSSSRSRWLRSARSASSERCRRRRRLPGWRPRPGRRKMAQRLGAQRAHEMGQWPVARTVGSHVLECKSCFSFQHVGTYCPGYPSLDHPVRPLRPKPLRHLRSAWTQPPTGHLSRRGDARETVTCCSRPTTS